MTVSLGLWHRGSHAWLEHGPLNLRGFTAGLLEQTLLLRSRGPCCTDIKLSIIILASRQDSQPRARFIGGSRSVILISFSLLCFSASSRWVFIRARNSSNRSSFIARIPCRHVRTSFKCYRSLVRRRDLSMTSEGVRTQKSTPLPRLGTL